MSKKKNIEVSRANPIEYDLHSLIGLTIETIINDNHIILKKGKKRYTLDFEEEGSYSDWWETSISYKQNEKIAYFYVDEDIDKGKITIAFANEEGKTILHINSIFHNGSDWDYGCYVCLYCNELRINQHFYI